ncbi:hypothetical protein [Acinetobacter sp. ESBL14]|uniref:hypothetical protein n=1 Tax=Acinetobacter sp. ESBL14 TaxID=3077329 RepID=UPI002FC96A28
MILDILRDDFFKYEVKPYQLVISLDTYYQIMRGERAMQSSFKIDRSGKLGLNISGCPIYVVDSLDSPYKWLVH